MFTEFSGNSNLFLKSFVILKVHLELLGCSHLAEGLVGVVLLSNKFPLFGQLLPAFDGKDTMLGSSL